jgi:hypothetical protein
MDVSALKLMIVKLAACAFGMGACAAGTPTRRQHVCVDHGQGYQKPL